MNRLIILTLFPVLVMFALSVLQVNAQEKPLMKEPATVDSVDLERYAGTWYEIAKIPNRFQRKCSRNTTATYRLRSDGRIDVVNRCVDDSGNIIEARGIAKTSDPETNAKLKVSFVRLFGISLFWGDYWIIGLDRDYSYAVIGTPSRKYGWILSRAPVMSETDLADAFVILEEQGYDPDDFEKSAQEER